VELFLVNKKGSEVKVKIKNEENKLVELIITKPYFDSCLFFEGCEFTLSIETDDNEVEIREIVLTVKEG
jgi:hypothetical protein